MFIPTVQVSSISDKLRRYEEIDLFFMQIAGYSLEELKELFAKGYTLTPPIHADRSLVEALEV